MTRIGAGRKLFTLYDSRFTSLLHVQPVRARPDLDFERHVQLDRRLHLALEDVGNLFGLTFRRFDEQLVVYLHDRLCLEARRAQSLVNPEHGNLDDVAGRPLNPHVDGLALGARADVAVAVVDSGDGADAPVERAHDARLARLLRHLFHVAVHARVGSVVIVYDLACLFARDADALREAERLDGVGDGEVDDLGEASLLFQLFLRARAEDETGRALVYVLALLEGVEHLRVLRDVREQTQLQLRVVGGDEDVALVGHEGAADAASQLGADGDVL